MLLKSLRVVNFRNIKGLDLELNPGLNVFVGANAQGKTNILEAAALLADGRSFRQGKINEMITHSFQESAVEGICISQQIENSLQIRLSRTRRDFLLDGKPVADLTDYLGRISFTVFSADFMNIVTGEPQFRRDFLDKGVFSINPSYLLLLRKFKRILKNRNTILRSPDPDLHLLQVLTEQFVDAGGRIAGLRLDYLRRIREFAGNNHQCISGGKESLRLEYQSSYAKPLEPDADISNQLNDQLKDLLKDEIEQRMTLAGPHRDDLRILIDEKDVRSYGSRGQKRTCVMALKLAELQLYQTKIGENPILVLDDIASELDADRQKTLLDLLPANIQMLVSLAEMNNAFYRKDMRLFRVRSGFVEEDRFIC
jgi:DNA replication and repair protein RecF